MKTPDFEVPTDAFSKAHLWFNDHPNEIKWGSKAPDNDTDFSFYKIGNQIYAKRPGHRLGEGFFGIVNLIKGENGKLYALKVESGSDTSLKAIKNQNIVLKELHQIHGTTLRQMPFDRNKENYLHFKHPIQKEQSITKKHYTILELAQGKNLLFLLNTEVEIDNNQRKPLMDTLTASEQLALLIQGSEVLQELHQRQIFHGDLGMQNLMINCDQDLFLISPVDFGESQMMTEENRLEKIENDFRIFCRLLKNKHRFNQNIWNRLLKAL